MKLEEKKLPNGWEVRKLGEVCNIQTGKYDANHAKSAGKFRFYTCAFDHMFCDTNRFKGESIILPGNGANVGEVFYFDGEFDAYQRTYVLNSFDKVYSKFLFYHLLCYWRKLNQDKQFGSATNYIRMGNFTDYEVPIPPLPEQQQIVAKIEELFSELENGKKELLIAQAKLKTYRQSLLKWAFEGRLTNENLKEGELPKGWGKIQIKDVADTLGGYAFKSGEFLNKGVYQVLRMGNVRSGLIRYEESPVFLNDIEDSVLKRSLLHQNDVIITQTGTRKKRDYGYTALIKKPNLLLNQRIASIRFRENYLPKFFLYFSWTDSFRDQFFANETGNVGQGNVGMKAVTETMIPCCSLEEQMRVISELESKLTICDAIEETIKTSINKCEALRQSILKKAFLGELLNKKNSVKCP